MGQRGRHRQRPRLRSGKRRLHPRRGLQGVPELRHRPELPATPAPPPISPIAGASGSMAARSASTPPLSSAAGMPTPRSTAATTATTPAAAPCRAKRAAHRRRRTQCALRHRLRLQEGRPDLRPHGHASTTPTSAPTASPSTARWPRSISTAARANRCAPLSASRPATTGRSAA